MQFYSGATGQAGRFSQGFCLRRVQFPLAIGGCLITKRVCEGCNSKLGTSVDAPLLDHLFVLVRRAELGIAGRGGVPDACRHILGDSVVASDPAHRLRVKIDPSTGKLDIRTIPSSRPQQMMPWRMASTTAPQPP